MGFGLMGSSKPGNIADSYFHFSKKNQPFIRLSLTEFYYLFTENIKSTKTFKMIRSIKIHADKSKVEKMAKLIDVEKLNKENIKE